MSPAEVVGLGERPDGQGLPGDDDLAVRPEGVEDLALGHTEYVAVRRLIERDVVPPQKGPYAQLPDPVPPRALVPLRTVGNVEHLGTEQGHSRRGARRLDDPYEPIHGRFPNLEGPRQDAEDDEREAGAHLEPVPLRLEVGPLDPGIRVGRPDPPHRLLGFEPVVRCDEDRVVGAERFDDLPDRGVGRAQDVGDHTREARLRLPLSLLEVLRKAVIPEAMRARVDRVERDRSDVQIVRLDEPNEACGLLRELAPAVRKDLPGSAHPLQRVGVGIEPGPLEDVGRCGPVVAPNPARDDEAPRNLERRPRHEVVVETHAEPGRSETPPYGRNPNVVGSRVEVPNAVRGRLAAGRDARPDGRGARRSDALEVPGDPPLGQGTQVGELSGLHPRIDQVPRAPIDPDQHNPPLTRRCEPESESQEHDRRKKTPHGAGGYRKPRPRGEDGGS